MDTVALSGHGLESFCEVLVDPFDHHWVMAAARENMAIDLKEIKCFTADPEEFAVFIENDCVTKPVAQLDFHDSRCKVFGISVLYGFQRGKACSKPPSYVPYKGTYVPYDGTYGASDQGQTLDDM